MGSRLVEKQAGENWVSKYCTGGNGLTVSAKMEGEMHSVKVIIQSGQEGPYSMHECTCIFKKPIEAYIASHQRSHKIFLSI